MGRHSFLFAATVWWTWRNRNMTCLGNDNWYVIQLSFNIQGMVNTIKASYSLITNNSMDDNLNLVKWNNNNHSKVILNVDGTVLTSPTRDGYGAVLRKDGGFYLSGFSRYIHYTSDILYAEVYSICQGLLLAKEKCIVDLFSYYDSLLGINFISAPSKVLCLHCFDSRQKRVNGAG